MEALLYIQKLNKALLKGAGWVVILAMAVIAVVIPFAVFSRYVLENTPTWSDEISLFCLVWASMLGAAISLQKGYQVGITYFLEKSPRPVSAGLRMTGYLLILAFLALGFLFGLRQTAYNIKQLSAALRIPMSVPYAALPTGFTLMFLITVEEMVEFLLGRSKPKNTEGGAAS